MWVISKLFWAIKLHTLLATCGDTGSSLLARTWFCIRNSDDNYDNDYGNDNTVVMSTFYPVGTGFKCLPRDPDWIFP
jgi:hypothetical protein